jgi:hypothetical protein
VAAAAKGKAPAVGRERNCKAAREEDSKDTKSEASSWPLTEQEFFNREDEILTFYPKSADREAWSMKLQ